MKVKFKNLRFETSLIIAYSYNGDRYIKVVFGNQTFAELTFSNQSNALRMMDILDEITALGQPIRDIAAEVGE